ncbi:hypothetical protein DYB26_013867 [Aphanomyces astaci]|uniref:EamA domain-containing protein n=1 Tax=Aphanomyces astaci TaxID=112090 RepID=A0A397FK70_APHAT|nr:hypothetical protein DYB31_012910 [Aphanomyces astaci]RHZ39014.1 hypothetical protein DYB26_013867 [Aphanomyces astaci]
MLTFFSGDRKRVTICPGNIPILTEVVSAPLLATTDGDSSLLSDVVDSQSTLGVPSVARIKPQKCPSPSKFRRSKLRSAIQRKIEHFRQHTGSLYGLALLAGGNVLFSFMASIQLRLKIPPFTVAPEFRKLLLCRALVGYVAMTLSFYAYSTMILSEAQVIICSSPIVTFILSVCFLGEMLDRVDFACVLVSFVGVVCVARPASLFGGVATSSPSGTSFASMLCAVLAACLIGVINILIRKLSALNTWTLVTYFLLACSVLSAAKITLFEQGLSIPTNATHVLTILGIGVLGCVGQVMITKGFQVEKAGIGSAMMYVNIVCVMIWDVTLLGESLHGWSVFGAAIICTGALTIAYRKSKKP